MQTKQQVATNPKTKSCNWDQLTKTKKNNACGSYTLVEKSVFSDAFNALNLLNWQQKGQ